MRISQAIDTLFQSAPGREAGRCAGRRGFDLGGWIEESNSQNRTINPVPVAVLISW